MYFDLAKNTIRHTDTITTSRELDVNTSKIRSIYLYKYIEFHFQLFKGESMGTTLVSL